MPWWQFRACVRALLADPHSQLAQHVAGDDRPVREIEVLYLIYDQLEAANWQRSGSKGNRPRGLTKLVAQVRHRARQVELASRDRAAVIDYLEQFNPRSRAGKS